MPQWSDSDGISGMEEVHSGSARLAGERRLVTVVFSDLCGYTSLSERTDPEDMQRFLGEVFGVASEVIERYGGTIDKFIGDAAMALFGAPVSHEDDALRCVAAARELHERVASIEPLTTELPPPAMHSGIETGVVLSGQVSSGRDDTTVLGDVVNVASRLGHVAGRGQIVVGPQTYALTRGSFEYEDLGEQEVRGRREQLRTFLLVGERRTPERVRSPGPREPTFVGREREIAALKDAVAVAADGGSGLVLVRGDAGTGKSRLIAEVCAALPDGVAVRTGYCYEYARDFPFYPLVDLLGRAWGLADDDSPEELRYKITSAVGERVGADRMLAARLARLWGLDSEELRGLDPESWRAQLPHDVASVLGALARESPTLVVLEDLHWADSSSLELLGSLLERALPAVVFLCTARPPFDFPDGVADEVDPRPRLVELDDLSGDDAVLLASSMLDTRIAPDGLNELLGIGTGANPFYLTELINSLIGSGALERGTDGWRMAGRGKAVEVTAGVHEMLAARVDRLGEPARRVLGSASVLGQSFSSDVLAATTGLGDTDGILEELVLTGLLEPFGSPGHFRFKHVLVKEAVYDRLLKSERRDLHESAGLAIERLYGARLPEYYEMLAMHFSLGHSKDRAARYMVDSAEKCVARFALEQADSYFEDALSLFEEDPELSPEKDLREVDLVTRWAPVFWYMGDFHGLEGLLDRYADSVRREVEGVTRGRFATWFGTACWNRQRLEPSRDWLEEALRVARRLDDPMTECFARAMLAYTLTDLGRIEEAIDHGIEAGRLADGFAEDHLLVSHAHGATAYAYWAAGRPDGATRAGSRLLRHAETQSAERTTVFGLWATALGHVCDGDYAAAEDAIDRALEVSSDPWTSQFPRMFAGLCCIYRDDFAGARVHLEEVVSFADANGAATLATPARGLLGASLIGLGELGEGMALLDRAIEEFEEGRRPWGTAQAMYMLGSLHARIAARSVDVSPAVLMRNAGFVLRHVPRSDRRAQEELNTSLEMCERMGARGMAGRCRMELGDLAAARGRSGEAERYWSEAVTDFEACGAGTLLEVARGRVAGAVR